MAPIVVIGAGHNGLVAAARLAKRGQEVLVLEARSIVGGLAAGEEFVPGYRTVGLLQETCRLAPSVVAGLELERMGLERGVERPSVLFPGTSGDGILMGGAASDAAKEIARQSPRDAERYVAYREFIDRMRRVFDPLIREAPPNVFDPKLGTVLQLARKGIGLRRLGKADMLETLRIAPMCAADALDEWFETDLLKAGMAGPAVYGTFLGPWSPGSNMNLLLWEIAAAGAVQGGAAGVTRALESAARGAGASIRTDARVAELRVSSGSVTGVVLEGGEEIATERVIASCDPRQTLLKLVPAVAMSRSFEHNIEIFRARGTTAAVHLALDAPLQFRARPGLSIEFARTGETIDGLERAFDVVKYRAFPTAPILEIAVPTVSNPQLAPSGHSVVSLLVHFVPFDLEDGWTDDRRAELGDLAVETLASYTVDLSDRIVGREVLTPADLGSRYSLTGGHIHHGEMALDQLFLRPTPETSRYGTPIGGLFLGGSGSHPGGGITGMPGWLAAGTVLES